MSQGSRIFQPAGKSHLPTSKQRLPMAATTMVKTGGLGAITLHAAGQNGISAPHFLVHTPQLV